MKTKNIFKALALAMLMPATMLNIACSSEDDLAANNNEITNKKGFEIPVTINVTRQGDATTRATYTDNGASIEFTYEDVDAPTVLEYTIDGDTLTIKDSFGSNVKYIKK